MSSETGSLFELNEYIRRVVALNFPEPLWVRAEIAQLSESKDHYYLQLVEKAADSTDIIARNDAVIWAPTYRRLFGKYLRKLKAVLQPGLEVRLLVQADYHEQYGLKLIIEDIDPDFSIGQVEQQRLETIETLKSAGIFDQNRALRLPPVLQRIAVLSSPNAAGLQDFTEHLRQNIYVYSFKYQLFPIAVQGIHVEREFLTQIKKIESARDQFDCIALIRGGGSKLDLGAFDQLEVARAVATCTLPVLTGIGHETDRSVVDLVAFQALKTPTAVADFLINQNARFEAEILHLGQLVKSNAGRLLKQDQIRLEHLSQQLAFESKKACLYTANRLENLEMTLRGSLKMRLNNERNDLRRLADLVEALNPENAMKRGFTLTTKAGKVVTSAHELRPGDRIETHFADGRKQSIVQATEKTTDL